MNINIKIYLNFIYYIFSKSFTTKTNKSSTTSKRNDVYDQNFAIQ